FLVLLNSMRLLWFERPVAVAQHPAWSGIRRSFDQIDHWMEHHLNLDEALHWLSHHGKAVAVAAIGLLLAAYFLSGITVVGPDEVEVVRRFGKPHENPLESGLHWCWPWPVDSVLRVQPD